MKKLFIKIMSKDLAGEILLDETKLKGHGKIVMDALGAAVECLDDSTQLTSLLIGIGERHALYGVQPNMIPVCIGSNCSFYQKFKRPIAFRFWCYHLSVCYG